LAFLELGRDLQRRVCEILLLPLFFYAARGDDLDAGVGRAIMGRHFCAQRAIYFILFYFIYLFILRGAGE